MTATFTDELIARLCRDATSAHHGATVLDVVRDPLDDSVWVCLSSWPARRRRNNLTTEWDATVELANYCYDRRLAAGDQPDPADVLADVEATMRRAVPLPHRAPNVPDVEDLLNLITAAEDAYEGLIGEHVDHAERALA